MCAWDHAHHCTCLTREVLLESLQMKKLRNTTAMLATMWPSRNLSLNLFESSVLSFHAPLSASGWDSMPGPGGLGVSSRTAIWVHQTGKLSLALSHLIRPGKTLFFLSPKEH